MRKKTFGFLIGESRTPVEIKEKTEKKAVIKFVEKFWKRMKEEKGEIIIRIIGERKLIK